MVRKGKSRKIRSKSSASPAEGADIAEPEEIDLAINLITYQSKNGEKSFKTYKRAKILGENGLSSIVKTPPSGKGKMLASSDQTAMHSSKRQRTQIPNSSSGNGIFLESTVQDLPDGISANGSGSVEQAVVSPAVAEGHRGEVIDSNSVPKTVKKAASVEPNDEKKNSNDLDVTDHNNEKGEMEVRVVAVEGNSHLIDSYDQSLPFLKTRFNIWKDIESMEAFQAVTQKPHFQMLVNECPEAREGKAIGYMIMASSIAKKVAELWLDDPRGSIGDCLKKLVKLEKNGFDIKAIRDCLNSLLTKKDEYDNLLNQLKEHENQLMEHNCEKMKILEEIGKLDEKINEFTRKA